MIFLSLMYYSARHQTSNRCLHNNVTNSLLRPQIYGSENYSRPNIFKFGQACNSGYQIMGSFEDNSSRRSWWNQYSNSQTCRPVYRTPDNALSATRISKTNIQFVVQPVGQCDLKLYGRQCLVRMGYSANTGPEFRVRCILGYGIRNRKWYG